MTPDNKAALEALDNLYASGMSVTRAELCLFINKHGNTIRTALAPQQVDVEGLIPEDFNKFFGAVRNALDGRAEKIDGINALEKIAVVFNRVRLAQRGLLGSTK